MYKTEKEYDAAINKANAEIIEFVKKNPKDYKYKTETFQEIKNRQLNEVSRIQNENKDLRMSLIYN